MEIGRNAPCPCGSGKKYKKCCLQKDEEAQREAVRTALEQPMPAKDPHIQAMDELWDAFKAEDYEGKIRRFSQTLEEGGVLDSEIAFEVLNQIYSEALRCDQCERVDRLIDDLHEKRPDLYNEDAHFYLDWQVTIALVSGRTERVSELMRQLAPRAARDIDTFSQMIDRLAYHGQTAVLAETMRTAWPQVEDASGIVPEGIDEFCTRGFYCVVFDYMERFPDISTAEPALVEQVEFFCESDTQVLGDFMAYLSGRTQQVWSMDDFVFEPRRASRRTSGREEDPTPEPAGQHLYDLTVEFLGWLWREGGVAYIQGEMGRIGLFEYIMGRHTGELPSEDSLYEYLGHPLRNRQQPRHSPSNHLLCPDSATLNCFLGSLQNFMSLEYYKVAAVFELVPAWLRFLESRQLIGSAERKMGLKEISGLYPVVSEILANYREDPAPHAGVQRAWQTIVD